MEWCSVCSREVGVLMDVEGGTEDAGTVRFLCIHCRAELYSERRDRRPRDERSGLPAAE